MRCRFCRICAIDVRIFYYVFFPYGIEYQNNEQIYKRKRSIFLGLKELLLLSNVKSAPPYP